MDRAAPRALAAALGLVAAAAFLLPWWRGRPVALLTAGPTATAPPDSWAGWELTGPLPPAAVVALSVAGLVAGRGPRVRWLFPVAGAVALGAAVVVLGGLGVSPAPGAWVTAVAGLGAAGLGAVGTGSGRWRRRRRRRRGGTPAARAAGGPRPAGPGRPSAAAAGGTALLSGSTADARPTADTAPARRPARIAVEAVVVALVALAVPLLPGAVPPPPRTAVEGAWERVAVIEPGTALRTGATRLPDPAEHPLTAVDGRAAVVLAEGVAGVDENGRVQVLARTAGGKPGGVLGTAEGRVARVTAPDVVTVSALRPGDPFTARITLVAAAGPVGPDGTVWLRSATDPPGAVRRLDLGSAAGTLRADHLPLVTIGVPRGVDAVDPTRVLPVPGGGGVRLVGDGDYRRLELITATAALVSVAPVATGTELGCGEPAGVLAVDAGGAVWFTRDGRPARVGPDGRLRVHPDPVPGPVRGLGLAPDGALLAVTPDAVWRLPDPEAGLTPPPPAC